MHHRTIIATAALSLALSACDRRQPETVRGDSVALAPADTAGTTPDTTLAAKGAPPPPLALVLPAPPGGAMGERARALADLAVFAPRTTRWFIARLADADTVHVDIGRLDATPAPGDSAALAVMLAATSPVQPGLPVDVHAGSLHARGAVARLAVRGRRLVAVVPFVPNAPVDWAIVGIVTRPDSAPPRRGDGCTANDGEAQADAIERLLAGATRTEIRVDARPPAAPAAPRDAPRGSAIAGCFGPFRGVVVRRPADATPDATERAWLLTDGGKARPARLRDLSYPLHDLLGVTDVDGDGTDELLVRSHRPAMETIAALRMTDSLTFTRFAAGFTVERR